MLLILKAYDQQHDTKTTEKDFNQDMWTLTFMEA